MLIRHAALALCVLLPGTAAAGTLTGAAYYLERMALPPDAVLEVVVADVSLADAPARTLGRTTMEPAGQVPIAFRVNYDDAALQPGHRYAIRASIRVAGALLYTTTEHHAVLENAASGDVGRLKLTRVTGNSPVPDRAVEDTYWRLTRLGRAAVVFGGPGREPSLTLHAADHRATGSGGCNTFTGSYDLKGETLTLASMASTMMACVPGMETEATYHAALAQVRKFRIKGDTLELTDEHGASVATFVAVDL